MIEALQRQGALRLIDLFHQFVSKDFEGGHDAFLCIGFKFDT